MQLESILYNCTSAFFKVTYSFVFHFRAVYTHCHISMITQPAICSFDVFLDCVGVVQRIITLIRCCVIYVMSQTVRNLVFDDDDEQ